MMLLFVACGSHNDENDDGNDVVLVVVVRSVVSAVAIALGKKVCGLVLDK
jgi:hypothetical protein